MKRPLLLTLVPEQPPRSSMGLIKYQKGKITGVNSDTPEQEEQELPKKNGHNQDMHCPHGVNVNACKICAARPATEPGHDSRS